MQRHVANHAGDHRDIRCSHSTCSYHVPDEGTQYTILTDLASLARTLARTLALTLTCLAALPPLTFACPASPLTLALACPPHLRPSSARRPGA